MLDIKLIREKPELVEKSIKDRGMVGAADVDKLLKVDEEYVGLLQRVETHRALRNTLSSDISKVKKLEKKRKIG